MLFERTCISLFLERTLEMDNLRKTEGYGFKGFSKLKIKLYKGHKKQFHKLMKKRFLPEMLSKYVTLYEY